MATLKKAAREDGAVTVPLDPHFRAWLEGRAAAHGEPPGAHAARVLRQFWAHHDTWRHGQGAGGTRPRGAPAPVPGPEAEDGDPDDEEVPR